VERCDIGNRVSGQNDTVAVYYATRDGQARRIAEHICRRLDDGRVPPAPRNLLPDLPAPAELAQAPLIVLVAAVRYGKHLPEVEQFLTAYRNLPAPPSLALASVNLSARKAGKTTESGNPYLRKTIARHRLKPALAVAFAGRLDYRRYSWRDRQIIRFIMLLTGGPTDPNTSIEYTSWDAVEEFAAQVAALRGKQ
jgi:menaquinone-dependent protoporphyrinogen oxidase